MNSNFQPKLVEELGEGGQAKVFQGKFHGEDVAMKYIPLDKVIHGYKYTPSSYGCHEFALQEKFSELLWLGKRPFQVSASKWVVD